MWFLNKKKETKPMTSNVPDQTIAAHPGYSILRFTYLDRKATVDFVRAELKVLPIVAWRMVDGAVLPVAIGDMQQQPDGAEAILCPSGMICDVAGRRWKSVDAFAQDVTLAWKAWLGARPEEAPPVSRPLTTGDVVFGSRQSGFLQPGEVV
jgi:hypothetical protein